MFELDTTFLLFGDISYNDLMESVSSNFAEWESGVNISFSDTDNLLFANVSIDIEVGNYITTLNLNKININNNILLYGTGLKQYLEYLFNYSFDLTNCSIRINDTNIEIMKLDNIPLPIYTWYNNTVSLVQPFDFLLNEVSKFKCVGTDRYIGEEGYDEFVDENYRLVTTEDTDSEDYRYKYQMTSDKIIDTNLMTSEQPVWFGGYIMGVPENYLLPCIDFNFEIVLNNEKYSFTDKSYDTVLNDLLSSSWMNLLKRNHSLAYAYLMAAQQLMSIYQYDIVEQPENKPVTNLKIKPFQL